MMSPTFARVTSGEKVFPAFPTAIVYVVGPFVLDVAFTEAVDCEDDADVSELIAEDADEAAYVS